MSKCSERTRNAIENDEDVKVISQIKFKDSFWIVKDFRARKMIRAEIMDLVTDYLFTFYGGFGIPSKNFLAMITKWYFYSFFFCDGIESMQNNAALKRRKRHRIFLHF